MVVEVVWGLGAARGVGFGPQIKFGATESWGRALEVDRSRFPLGGGNDVEKGRRE